MADPAPELLGCCPNGERRMGANSHANGGRLPGLPRTAAAGPTRGDLPGPGRISASAMQAAGGWLTEVMRATEARRNFRIVCPDELTSNKLDEVLEATARA